MNRLADDDPWSTGHTRRRWIPHIPDSPEGFDTLGPRRVPTAVIAGIPVPDQTSSQHVADQLAALLNARPARMAGAVWAVFRHELHPRSHMGEVLAQITDPELPPDGGTATPKPWPGRPAHRRPTGRRRRSRSCSARSGASTRCGPAPASLPAPIRSMPRAS